MSTTDGDVVQRDRMDFPGIAPAPTSTPADLGGGVFEKVHDYVRPDD